MACDAKAGVATYERHRQWLSLSRVPGSKPAAKHPKPDHHDDDKRCKPRKPKHCKRHKPKRRKRCD